jgi:hypothetical protein
MLDRRNNLANGVGPQQVIDNPEKELKIRPIFRLAPPF